MRVHDLAPAPGASKSGKRVGRGTGGKGGKTAGRGTKGQRARNTVRRGFEGGQNPLKQRVPKLKGFTNPFRVEYSAVNLDTLAALAEDGESTITPEVLHAHGIVRKDAFVKVLARGELSAKIEVHAHGASKAAQAAIEAAGGSLTLIELPFKAEGKAGRPAAKGNQFTNR
ncbi:MAG: 50S ribosomal protein L15 [Ilumatobacter fluminis]|uniref:Large ribosomal subunit protein uL15 n=1 Tax=Ilumatobacter fluminis TaxID=467091 RepID=A0A4R7HX88_9ACTN|nr:50S ribosomal protein L15 [Ilumatobacter fluminis]TDT15350.1 LSU ribosomal protein L15P [Ilumatobacter fluminis]